MDKATTTNDLYESDFYEWTREQAKLLRERRWADFDLENLVEEVASVARSDKREIRSRLIVLIAHLLKWKFQPGARSASSAATIQEQRRGIVQVLEDSPSLERFAADQITNAYGGARLLASQETGIALDLFPDACPFSPDDVLGTDFLPDEPGHIGTSGRELTGGNTHSTRGQPRWRQAGSTRTPFPASREAALFAALRRASPLRCAAVRGLYPSNQNR